MVASDSALRSASTAVGGELRAPRRAARRGRRARRRRRSVARLRARVDRRARRFGDARRAARARSASRLSWRACWKNRCLERAVERGPVAVGAAASGAASTRAPARAENGTIVSTSSPSSPVMNATTSAVSSAVSWSALLSTPSTRLPSSRIERSAFFSLALPPCDAVNTQTTASARAMNARAVASCSGWIELRPGVSTMLIFSSCGSGTRISTRSIARAASGVSARRWVISASQPSSSVGAVGA